MPSNASTPAGSGSTAPERIAPSAAETAVVVLVGAVVGGALLALLPTLLDWLLQLSWVPFEGPLRLLEQASSSASWWVLGLVGLALGAAVGLALSGQSVVVTVDDRELVITEGSQRTRLARSQVHHVALEGRRLSLRDDRDVDLASRRIDGEPTDLRAALQRHGWPV